MFSWLASALQISREKYTSPLMINGEEIDRWKRSSRYLYLYHGLVLKLDGLCNRGQVLSEILLWPEISDEDREFFVPLEGCGTTASGEFWVAQELFDDHEIVFSKNQENLMYGLMKKYNISDVYPTSHSNCTIIDGTPKIYDWGLNHHWFEMVKLHDSGSRIPKMEFK